MGPFGTTTGQRIGQRLWLDYHLSARMPACLNVIVYEREMPPEVDFRQGIEVGMRLAGAQERRFEDFAYRAETGDPCLCASWEPHGWQVLAPGVPVRGSSTREMECPRYPRKGSWASLRRFHGLLTAAGGPAANAAGPPFPDDLLTARSASSSRQATDQASTAPCPGRGPRCSDW